MARLAVLYESWLMHSEVGADEVAVLAVLALHSGKDTSTCFPSQNLLARILNRSRPWVCKVIARLVELGLVTKQHRTRDDGGERSCLYKLVTPEHPPCPVGDKASSAENTPRSVRDSVKAESELILDTPPAGPPDDSTNIQLEAMTPPEDWQPTDSDLLWAIERFPDVDLQAATDRFINRCRAKGYRYRNLGSAWRSWLADDARNGRFDDRKQRGSASHSRFAVWAGVAQRAGSVHHAA